MRFYRLSPTRVALLVLCVAYPAAAAETGEAPPAGTGETLPRAAVDGVWDRGLRDPFRPGGRQWGFAAAGGLGLKTLGSRQQHDLILGTVHYGRHLSPRWSWLVEAFGGVQVSPEDEFLAGGVFLIRYHFTPGRRWVPFATVGAGLTYTSIRRPDLGTGFEFNLQGGLGMHYFFEPDQAFTLEGRWLHLSNAGIDSPNRGANTVILLGGVTWFF
ncbi:MAG: acyloxyacyl hydrolase [Armatimonadota bacterium]